MSEDLSEGLQWDFKELREYYDADDWFVFDTFFEAVEVTVKAYYLAGKTSREDLNTIFRKYGIV